MLPGISSEDCLFADLGVDPGVSGCQSYEATDFLMNAPIIDSSTQLILWPFQGKDGPMGKPPRILAPAQVQADVVACHPKQEVVAVGYADGLVLLVRIEDGAEVLARKGADAPIAALAWSASGAALAFGAEDGAAGVIDLG